MYKCHLPSGKVKQSYKTQKNAISAAIGASRASGIPLRVYKCNSCGRFHLTKEIRNA